jgi:hypothetical protein
MFLDSFERSHLHLLQFSLSCHNSRKYDYLFANPTLRPLHFLIICKGCKEEQ